MQTDYGEQLIALIPRLRRFACGLTGNADNGDELVQAACERLLKHQHSLSVDTRLDSWLFRVIRNLYLDGLRAQAVRERGADQVRQQTELRPGGAERLEDQLRLYEVDEAMRRLPERQRAVLLLVCVEGLSYKEAAGVLQVPIGTVTSRLLRGRKALADMMEAGDAGNGREMSK